MQRRNGAHDRETKSITRQTPASVQTVEAFDYPWPLSRRDAGAVVLNRYRDAVSLLDRLNPHCRPIASIFQRVVNEVYGRAREEVLVSHCNRVAFDVDGEGDFFILRRCIIQLGNIDNDGSE